MPNSSVITEPPDGVWRSEDAVAPRAQTRVVLQILFVIVGVAGGLWMLHRLASLVLVLIVAALFAYVIAPLVRLAETPIRIAGRSRCCLSRGAAIAVVYVLVAGSVSAGAVLLLPSATEQVDDIIARAPAYSQSILVWEKGWSRYYARLRIPPELRQGIDQSVLGAGSAALEYARGTLMALVGALSYLPWLVLIPILAFFLLRDAASIRRAIVTTLPHRIRLRSHRLFDEVNTTVASYIRAQLLACVLVGTLCGIGFALLGMPYPVLLGVMAGVLEFIPLAGPLLLALIVSVVGALHGLTLVIWAVAFLGILRVIEDYVIYPRLVRRSLHLHPLAVIVTVLAGAELSGVAGMFLAVPTVAIATVLYRHGIGWRAGDAVSDVQAN